MALPRCMETSLGGLFRPTITCFLPTRLRRTSLPFQSIRCVHRKKRGRKEFLNHDLKLAEQFSLLDAMHYIRAFEVGRNPSSVKYEVAVSLRTLKNGAVIRNRMRLPHPVKTDLRICVIAAPDSKAAVEARAAGASLVGEDEIFDQIKNGIIEFDRCICHLDSFQKLTKSGVARILGPRGLMPSTKTGTVMTTVGSSVRDMVSATEYRERMGVVRAPVGQLRFTPEELQTNIQVFMTSIKRDIARLSDRISKEVHEVVLSSTGAPGFSLTGEYRGANSVSPKELSGPL